MEHLRAFDGHGLLQHRHAFQFEGRIRFADVIRVIPLFALTIRFATYPIYICIAGRVVVRSACIGRWRRFKRLPVDNHVVVHLAVLHGVGRT